MVSFIGYGKIIFSCLVVYLFIIIAIRLLGKKELAQLSVLDLVFVLLISNSVQNAMVGSDTSLMGGITAAAALFAVNYLFKWALYKFPKFSKSIQGHPQLLIYKGKLLEQNLKKIQLSKSELEEAIREHGARNIADVDEAVFEVDGNISIISKEYTLHTLKKKKNHKIELK
ncbi:MAG: DUF421 domain-containing protein [Bacteroidales bacterium]